MGFLGKLLILAIVGTVGAGAVALFEWLMFEPPKPAVSGEHPSPPVVKKSPEQQWTWPNAG
ncbi:hypothetical protein P9273_03950 [Mesorhizobium sp. WSM4935]|uniref:hypothetical protein n=1 Tax=Mesorhizobium sp. WSM4935 TaxID=3038547 RepID=UPI002415549B|nr:hypothetical protein [Mesorhizobium sp. WSM4935]MDG4874251.1 hypothetical protein [Mesorhizobium sp. WSM4935]